MEALKEVWRAGGFHLFLTIGGNLKVTWYPITSSKYGECPFSNCCLFLFGTSAAHQPKIRLLNLFCLGPMKAKAMVEDAKVHEPLSLDLRSFAW